MRQNFVIPADLETMRINVSSAEDTEQQSELIFVMLALLETMQTNALSAEDMERIFRQNSAVPADSETRKTSVSK